MSCGGAPGRAASLAHDLERADADVGVDVQPRGAGRRRGRLGEGDVEAVVVGGRGPGRSPRRPRRRRSRTRPRARGPGRGRRRPRGRARSAGRQVDVGEVDVELAHADPVLGAQLAMVAGRYSRSPIPPSTSMSAAATTPSGSTSTSAGTISQRAPPAKAGRRAPARHDRERWRSPCRRPGAARTNTPGRPGGRDPDQQARSAARRCGPGRRRPPAESAPQHEAEADHSEDEHGAEEEGRSAEKRHQGSRAGPRRPRGLAREGFGCVVGTNASRPM